MRVPLTTALAGAALLASTGCTAASDRRTTPRPAAPTSAVEALTWPDPDTGRRIRPAPRLYDHVCLDPPAGLVDTEPVRQQGRSVREGEATVLDRALVYPDAMTAAEALADLRAEVVRCGRTRSHNGARLTWTGRQWSHGARGRLERRVPDGVGTETWHLYATTVPAAPIGAFVTLVRVGVRVLVSDRRSGLDVTTAAGLATAGRAGEQRLLDAVAALSPNAGRQGG
ncbi:MAG: hypothetical protein Q7J48_06140 [Nocardioides sp.]|nr:hypothetical protein [Nocardioides sp.]